MSENDISQAVNGAVQAAQDKAKTGAGQSGKAQRGKRKPNFSYKVDDTGVFRKVERDADDGSKRTVWQRFGSELHVCGLTRNDDGEDWGRLLLIVDRDGGQHLWAMPATLLAGSGDQLQSELFRLGFELEPDRKYKAWLKEYITSASPENRVRCVSRIGWHNDTYVLPDGPIGAVNGTEQVILQSSERPDHAFNVAGTLAQWQSNVADLATGNSRLVLSIAAGFAAPMLELVGDDGGGFHFSGGSSIRKSTALIVAGSVWGGGGTRGYIGTWRSTSNAMEGRALLHNDCLLALDEIGESDPKELAKSIYMLANGVGKDRMNASASLRKPATFRVMFLSTGEGTLVDRAREAGEKIPAGVEARLVSLRADAGAGQGIFENIHGSDGPASFAQRLKKNSNTYYGAAGREFVTELVKDLPQYREKLATMRRGFVEAIVPDGADGQVRRVADRFALVAAAGEIATSIGVTGWPEGEALNAAQRCFQDWLSERGGIGASEVTEAKRRISEALQLHGASRFQKWEKSNSDRMVITNRMGFKRLDGDPEIETDHITYFFMAQPLKDILAGLDFRTVVAELHRQGVIMDQNGKPTKAFHVPNDRAKNRLYQINHHLLDTQWDDDGTET